MRNLTRLLLALAGTATLSLTFFSAAATAAPKPAATPTAVFTPAAGTVTVANPGNQFGSVFGNDVNLQMTATGGVSPYTWSAVSLPFGVRINTSTGLITGVPGRAGTTHPTVSATDTTGQVGSVTFAWQINPIPCPHC